MMICSENVITYFNGSKLELMDNSESIILVTMAVGLFLATGNCHVANVDAGNDAELGL